MASSGKKPEKFTILEQIYHDNNPEQQSENKDTVKTYFQDSKRVDKLLSGAAVSLGLVGIVLGLFLFRSNLTKYFKTSVVPFDEIVQEDDENDLLGLRQRDTDEDGLSDYDELYLYGTSLYIPDTDSDGINDFDEIAKGSNPNCSEGENCFAVWSNDSGEATNIDSLLLNKQIPASQIRLLLQQSGASSDELSQFTDDELIRLYNDVLLEAQSTPSSESQTTNLSAEEIEKLTPEQLRSLLKNSGASSDLLDTISDQELMELVQETLNSTN